MLRHGLARCAALTSMLGLAFVGGVLGGCSDRSGSGTVLCDNDIDCDADSVCDLSGDGPNGVCVPDDGSDNGDADEAGDEIGNDDDAGDDGDPPPPQRNADLDILFVIDNSGSMGGEQAKLAVNLQAFIQRLDAANLNFRIGFATTDNGNVECSGTTPEGGKLRLISCTQRPDEFVWPKVNPQVMAYDQACGNLCPFEIGDALTVIPTATANDPEVRPRPWIERIEGQSNIDGATLAQAAACLAPQGVDGCGFEAPLESMFKAIQRSSVTSETQFDFFRETAAKLVVFVTDEADCSANEAQQAAVFDRNLPQAQKVFWEDPSSSIPTSAICWNAGVMCIGSPGGYDDCIAADYAVDGSQDPVRPSDDAVLRPADRYVNLLQEIEDQQKNFNPGNDLMVAVIGGVPVGYGSGTELVYRESNDPADDNNYGIDFGCVDPNDAGAQAIPPVRLREVAEHFDIAEGGRNLHSICGTNFVPAFDAIADELDQVLGIDI